MLVKCLLSAIRIQTLSLILMIILQGRYYAYLHFYKCGKGRSERLSTLSDIAELGSANVCFHNLCSVHSSALSLSKNEIHALFCFPLFCF